MWTWNNKKEQTRNSEELVYAKSSIITSQDRDILAEYLSKPEAQILVAFLKEELLTESYLASISTKEVAEVYAITRVAKDDAIRKVITFIQGYPKARFLESAKESKTTEADSAAGTYPGSVDNF